jgi:hypothetical protein
VAYSYSRNFFVKCVTLFRNLRLSQECCPRFKSSGMLFCVWLLLADVRRNVMPSSSGSSSSKITCFTIQDEILGSLETSGSTRPIPKDTLVNIISCPISEGINSNYRHTQRHNQIKHCLATVTGSSACRISSLRSCNSARAIEIFSPLHHGLT